VLVIFVLLVASAGLVGAQTASQQPPQNGGATAPSGARFHMLRGSSGTKGVERDGRFILADPRTVFYLGEDHKIIVEFEWEGPVGPHKFEALWKDPTGKVAIVSDFQFAPQKPEFAGYWSMLLDDTAPTGLWTLDARIDGETAGTYTFEVAARNGAASTAPPAARLPLSPADIYRQAQFAMVSISKLDAAGKVIDAGSGFLIGPALVLTSFGTIDGATSLRIGTPNGQAQTLDSVVAWNRWQDWAVLRVDVQGAQPLKLANDKSWNVGERCYVIGNSNAGRTIQQGSIVGDTKDPRAGERLSLSNPFDSAAVGSPVFNEFGDVIALMSGSLLPGSGDVTSTHTGGMPPQAGSSVAAQPSLGVVIGLVKMPTADKSPVTFADLTAKGEFITPLQQKDQVAFGSLSLGIDLKNGPGWPKDPRDQFSKSDKQMIVFVNWVPQKKFKDIATLRFYDIDNHQLSATSPVNVKLRSGNFSGTYWTVPLSGFPAGSYRADVYLGDFPVWRSFFRVIP
jgi:hypothetical protein